MLAKLDSALLVSVLVACSAVAQEGGPAIVGLSIPMHTGADGVTWCAEGSFKACFDDGYAFYPRLGASGAEGMSLCWKTLAARCGGESVSMEGEPERRHESRRFEFDYGGMVEAYDVRPEGVEQTFVFTKAPRSGGDLEITGRIGTGLFAEPVTAAHQALLFRDDRGEEVLRYGEACAFDAAGRRTDVTTAFDGDRITLRIGRDWLRNATFPVTVDPLTAPTDIATVATTSPPTSMAMARDDRRQTHNLLVVCTYATSGNDHDAVAYLMNDDFSSPVAVMSEQGTATNSLYAAATYVRESDRFVISVGNQVYFHDAGDLTLNGGLFVASPATTALGVPPQTQLGNVESGSASERKLALLVWSGNWTASPFTLEALGAVIDAASRTVGATFSLSKRPNTGPLGPNHRDLVHVIPESGGLNDSWIVAWRERLSIGNDQTLFLARVTRTGVVADEFAVYGGTLAGQNNPQDVRLAGYGVQSMLVYTVLAGIGAQQIVVVPYVWSKSSATPTLGAAQALVTSGPQKTLHSLRANGLLAGEWILVHSHSQGGQPATTVVDRIDSSGLSIERDTLPAPIEDAAADYGLCFAMVTAERTNAQTVALRGRLFSPHACAGTPLLNVVPNVKGGLNYMMYVNKPTSASDNTVSQVFLSTDPTPSAIPNIVSLSLGGGFTSLFLWPEIESFGPGVCAGAILLPSVPGLAGARVYYQAFVADFDQPSIFPLQLSNLVTVDFL